MQTVGFLICSTFYENLYTTKQHSRFPLKNKPIHATTLRTEAKKDAIQMNTHFFVTVTGKTSFSSTKTLFIARQEHFSQPTQMEQIIM